MVPIAGTAGTDPAVASPDTVTVTVPVALPQPVGKPVVVHP